MDAQQRIAEAFSEDGWAWLEDDLMTGDLEQSEAAEFCDALGVTLADLQEYNRSHS